MMPAPYSADLRWRVIWFVMLSRGQLAVRKAISVESLSKHDVDGSEIVIWKCHFALLQSFNYSKSLCLKNRNERLGQDKIEHLSSYAHVVHTTAKKVISRHRKNEDVFKMSKEEKCTCKACKNSVFHCQICKSVGFLLPSCLRRTHCFFLQIWKPQFLSVVQFPFDNCHSPFSPTFFEIGVCR